MQIPENIYINYLLASNIINIYINVFGHTLVPGSDDNFLVSSCVAHRDLEAVCSHQTTAHRVFLPPVLVAHKQV